MSEEETVRRKVEMNQIMASIRRMVLKQRQGAEDGGDEGGANEIPGEDAVTDVRSVGEEDILELTEQVAPEAFVDDDVLELTDQIDSEPEETLGEDMESPSEDAAVVESTTDETAEDDIFDALGDVPSAEDEQTDDDNQPAEDELGAADDDSTDDDSTDDDSGGEIDPFDALSDAMAAETSEQDDVDNAGEDIGEMVDSETQDEFEDFAAEDTIPQDLTPEDLEPQDTTTDDNIDLDRGDDDFILTGTEQPSLLADVTQQTTASALSEIARAAVAQRALALGNGKTIEDLVREALVPELKMWLDARLGPMVERIVREEIRKMVRRAEDL